MTLLENVQETYRESSIPVLETERLVLRAPQPEDTKAVVALASDRRVAENTAPFLILTARPTPWNG